MCTAVFCLGFFLASVSIPKLYDFMLAGKHNFDAPATRTEISMRNCCRRQWCSASDLQLQLLGWNFGSVRNYISEAERIHF
uniref:Secreted protein n=1 Tax=Setaria viridis TaxID=4556 RepID=A0A4U6UCR6_SETVI|nr:hypothetical protein SEVIR_6G012550v2 [Setaria viridis]